MPEGLWRRGNKPNLNFQATKDGAGSCESLTCLVSAMYSEDSTRQMVLLHNFGVCGHSTAMVACLCLAGHCCVSLHILVVLPFICVCSGEYNKVFIYVKKLLLSPWPLQNLSVSKCAHPVRATGGSVLQPLPMWKSRGPHWDQVASSLGTDHFCQNLGTSNSGHHSSGLWCVLFCGSISKFALEIQDACFVMNNLLPVSHHCL